MNSENGTAKCGVATAWIWKELAWIALVGLSSFSLYAVPPPAGVAPVLVPAGGFAIDGDLMANTPAANAGDWMPSTNSGSGGSVLNAAGVPLDPTKTFHFADPYNGNDTTFSGGLKWTDNPNIWTWTTGKASGKTDIDNVLLHITTDTNGHIWTIIAADRASTSGDSYIDFEFLQNTLTKNSNGTFTSAGTNGGRTTGDLLLSLAFGGGGSVADFFAWRWMTNGSGGFSYVDNTSQLPVGRVFVALNSNVVAVPYGAFGQTTYAANAFAEAAIDLTALLGSFNQCTSFGFKTIMVKTKTSQSSTATISDFIDPIQYTLKIGPGADPGPDQTRCTQGDVTDFPLQGTASAGLQPISSTSWSVVSGVATIDSPASLVTTAHVSSATATLALTVFQSNGCSETNNIVLNVAPLPACLITGPAVVCPLSTSQFSAPAGMNAYSWSITGDASISGATNARTVSVIAAGGCGTNFSLMVNVTSNSCVSSCSMDVTEIDVNPPTITCPPDRVLECPASTTTNANGVATAQDDCAVVTVAFSDSVVTGCGGTKVISRTWTATDHCGNSTNCIQTITVRDTTPPTITCPPNRTLECPADTSTNNNGIATAQDGCGGVAITYSDSVSNGCGGTEVISRLWTATDACGNSRSCVQTITVQDTTPPTVTCPPNLTLECPADTTTNATGVATAQDGCGSVTISYSDSVTNNCGGTKVISRTWTAKDQCGNSKSCIQTITVRDTTPPTVTCPPDIVLECPANTTTNVTGVATAQDGCGSVTIAYSDSVSNSCGGTKVISRTWTATDQCGNRQSCVQKITVQDTTPPTITCPPDRTLECPANTSTNANGVATAQDGCGLVTIAYSDSISNACGGTKVISRLWTATDQCGNSRSCVQTITVQDTTPPSITCPANVTLECPANTGTNNTGVATAQDGCGSVTVTYSDSVSNGCGGTKIISRLWTAKDQCGNSRSCLQTITVVDTTPPTITCPPNVTLECPANTSTNNTGVAVAQDGCGSVTVVYSDTVSNGCGGTKIISRLWTATDGCGNSRNCTQTITVVDTTPPTITCPPSVTLECPANTTTNNTGVATAQDGCGSVTISYSDSVSNSCGGTKVISRTWTAKDQCGNSRSCVQTITVVDTTPPTITCPPNVTLECPATNTGTNFTGVATATDGCGSVTITFSDSVTNGCGVTKTISRTWTATDQCGNSRSCVQIIKVQDTTAPTISCPPDVVLECPATTTTNATGMATAQDGCGSVTIAYSDSVSNICGGSKVISRRWTATDQCGNSRSCVQTITLRDTTPPTITCPPNVTLECGASTAPSATGTASAQDSCSAVSVSYSDLVSNICGGSGVISRLWTATDACGNSTSCLQKITLVDTTPPALTLPANVTQQCPGDTRTNVTGVARAVDACGSAIVSYSDIVSNGCGFTKTVWRTWIAVDQCGNATNGLQTIAVIDTTKPSISVPNISVQCTGDVPPAYATLADFQAAGGTASDACSSSLTFTQTSDSGLVGKCPGTVTRVYRVTDACGNYAEATQRITVDDTTPPVLRCPTSSIVECGLGLDPAITGQATATDNCSTASITYTDAIVDSQYNLSFYVADPDSGTGPYSPTYLKFGPGDLPCPQDAVLTGRSLDPLRNAVAYSTNSQLDALTSIGNVPMAFGQIVPFETVIQASGGPGLDHGTVEFTADWHTYTTSNQRFGYDTNYMIYCAFVDAADPGSIDPNNNARVQSYSSTIVNAGTSEEAIRGTFKISGLDSGDRIVVEIWVVLDSAMAGNAGGTVAASLVSAQKDTVPPTPISIGVQTDSLGNLGKIFPLPAPQQQPPLGPLPQQPPVLPGRTTAVINRTWTAVDDCGNASTCVQQITVRDTAPPVVTVPHDLILECPADTSTNSTGVATAQDACGTATLTYSDVVSNNCPGTKVVYRTWTAVDDAGNSTNVVQTITVQDTTPPALVCGPDRTVLVGDAWTFDQPTVTETCSTATLQLLNTVTNLTSTNTIIAARTWQAWDQCGNTNQCTQTITILLGNPPTITSGLQGQTAVYGGNLTLSVAAGLTGPLTYQWQLGGVVIPGATGSSLNLSGLKWSDAGLYSVTVSNAAGTATSGPVVVNVVPTIQVQRQNGMLGLTWPSPFILQSSTNVTGPYLDVPGVTSPCWINTSLNKQSFFRLRSQPVQLLNVSLLAGQFQLNCPGVPGCNFVIQASTNLTTWVNLQTNTSPFSFVDTNAWQYPRRFYRAMLAH